MYSVKRPLLGLLVLAAMGFTPALTSAQDHPTKGVATIRRVDVLGNTGHVEVEIASDARITPQVQMVETPDRLVLDFPNAVPAGNLRNAIINRAGVRGLRVGLDSNNPPSTRVVLDLLTALKYELFSSGNTIIVKFSPSDVVAPGGSPSPSGGVEAIVENRVPVTIPAGHVAVTTQKPAFTTEFEVVEDLAPQNPAVPPPPKVDVQFRNGSLSIFSNKATLAEVLFEIHKKTGADIPIPAGAEQEQVVANLGPGPAREVLATLLNGSRFNFIMVGSDSDPSQLKSVILSLKGGPVTPGPYVPPNAVNPVPPPAPISE